jgi:hypothetical protein
VVILIPKQKRRRRLAGNMSSNFRIQRDTLTGKGQMSRINSDGKIRAATFFVRRIDRWVQTLLEMRADRCDQAPAC